MPELPEVETVVRFIQPVISGRLIMGLTCFSPRSLNEKEPEFQCNLPGRRVTDVKRRGKYICLELDNGFTCTIHLRMTGKILFQVGERDRAHLRVILHLDCSEDLFFIDPRKFGRWQLWPDESSFLPGLGPEPLGYEAVRNALRNAHGKRPIKTVLLDQRILAGIGNIYADEALFRARIDPRKQVSTLSRKQIERLAVEIPCLLMDAISRQGTTLINYRTPEGRPGRNQERLLVYGREDSPCVACGEKVQRLRIGGRSSYFCPICQGHDF